MGTPFSFDSAEGNLLLDIIVSGLGPASGDPAFFEFMYPSQGLSSRYHDFGTGFDNMGLVTEFNNTVMPEPTTVLLFGTGLVGIAGFSRREFKKSNGT